MKTAEPPATEELLSRAASGDGLAMGDLLARYRDRLRRMVALRMDSRLAARVDASDIVLDALAAAASQMSGYLRDRSIPFYLWLRRIAWHRLVDVYRRHVGRQCRSVLREEPLGLNDDSAMQLSDQLLASKADPVRRLIRDELRARVKAMLVQLSEQDQEILVLHHLEQLSMSECAVIMNVSMAAAKKRYVRAIARLRDLLGPVENGWQIKSSDASHQRKF
ncbi:MAG: sigma-70 family RNA polymerase sigma factor [Thermoguttaceae bacterium]